jgi:hypothetical protein
MTNLRKLANGRDCLIRVPGHCCGDSTTVVLCHLRMINISGIGMKSADVLAAYGCQKCHDVVDRRTPSEYSPDELRLMHLEGIARTIDYLVSKQILRW